MSEKNQGTRIRQREPLTDAQMLMFISIGIFAAMYLAAMLTLKGGFLKPQQIFDLLNDNAALIIISCSLTVVMIGGGINISVGGVIGLTVMSCALFLNKISVESSFLSIFLTFLLALGIGLGKRMPVNFDVETRPVLDACEDVVAEMTRLVNTVVDNAPEELSADLNDAGVVLTGGGAVMTDLDRRVGQALGIPCRVADAPEGCAIRGLYRIMEDPDAYRAMLQERQSRQVW